MDGIERWIWESHGDDDFECVAALRTRSGDVKRVTWHPTEDVLVSVSYDESVRIWKEDMDGDDWSCVRVLGGEDGKGGDGHAGNGVVREVSRPRAPRTTDARARGASRAVATAR